MRSKSSYEQFDFISQVPEINKNNESIVQLQELLLIGVVNLILLTVDITISKILFLFTFTTIAIKLYKNFVLQKHIDRIQIKQIEVAPKSSLFIHFLTIFIYHLMESKSVSKNILMFGILTIIYLIFHFIRLNVVILIIINVCFIGSIYLKYKNKNKKRTMQIKRTESLLYNESSDLKKNNFSNIFTKDASQIIQEEQIQEDLKKSQKQVPNKQTPTSRLIV